MLGGKAASSSPKLEGDRRRSSRVGEGQRLVNKELDGRLSSPGIRLGKECVTTHPPTGFARLPAG